MNRNGNGNGNGPFHESGKHLLVFDYGDLSSMPSHFMLDFLVDQEAPGYVSLNTSVSLVSNILPVLQALLFICY